MLLRLVVILRVVIGAHRAGDQSGGEKQGRQDFVCITNIS